MEDLLYQEIQKRLEGIIKLIEKHQNKKKKEKKKYLDYVYLTDEEYEKLVLQFGGEETRNWIEKLDYYIASHGCFTKYKNHYKTILSWSLRRKEKQSKKSPMVTPAQEYGLTSLNELKRTLRRENKNEAEDIREWDKSLNGTVPREED